MQSFPPVDSWLIEFLLATFDSRMNISQLQHFFLVIEYAKVVDRMCFFLADHWVLAQVR